MRIGIITALSAERVRVEGLLGGFRACGAGVGPGGRPPAGFSPVLRRSCGMGALNGNSVVLVESGVGKVNAALVAYELIREFRPDCVVSTGVAGGASPSLSVMDVVAGKEVVYHDVDCGVGNAYGQVQGLPPRFACDGRLYRLAVASSRDGARVRGGLICSGDQFVSGRSRLDEIRARFPDVLAVEMESGAIAQTCHLCGVPFLSLRVISDTPGDDGPGGHYARYEDFWRKTAGASFAVTKAFLESLPSSLGEL